MNPHFLAAHDYLFVGAFWRTTNWTPPCIRQVFESLTVSVCYWIENMATCATLPRSGMVTRRRRFSTFAVCKELVPKRHVDAAKLLTCSWVTVKLTAPIPPTRCERVQWRVDRYSMYWPPWNQWTILRMLLAFIDRELQERVPRPSFVKCVVLVEEN